MKHILHSLTAWTALALPFAAAAQDALPIPKGPGLPRNIETVRQSIVCRGLNYVFTFAIIMGVLFLLIAAFRYITSGGSQEKVKEVHRAVTFAVVGIAVAIVAGTMPYLIGSFVGQGAIGNYCAR